MADFQACPWEWDSHGKCGKCLMKWDGTTRIAFPMGPMGQQLMSRKLKVC